MGNAANPIGIPTTAAPDSLNHSSPLRMSALASLAARTSANNSLRGSRKSDDSGQLKITTPGKGTDDRKASVKSRNTSQSSSKHRASLKVPPHHLTAGRPPVPAQYIEDCNAKFYEPRMLAARARLRWSPKIRRQALRLWRVAELKHKRMDKFEYLDFHLSVYRWLIDQNLNEDDIGPQDDHDALAAGLEDWERDCAAGCVGLTCDAFVVSLFQLADAWVDSANIADYVAFLHTLWQQTTIKPPSGKRRWRHRWPPEYLAANAPPTLAVVASVGSPPSVGVSSHPVDTLIAQKRVTSAQLSTWDKLCDVLPLIGRKPE